MVFNPTLQSDIRFQQPTAPGPNVFDAVNSVLGSLSAGGGGEGDTGLQRAVLQFQSTHEAGPWDAWTPSQQNRFVQEYPGVADQFMDLVEQTGAAGWTQQRAQRDTQVDWLNSPQGIIAQSQATALAPDDPDRQALIIEQTRMLDTQTQVRHDDLEREAAIAGYQGDLSTRVWEVEEDRLRDQAFSYANILAQVAQRLSGTGESVQLSSFAPDIAARVGDRAVSINNLGSVARLIRESSVSDLTRSLRAQHPRMEITAPSQEYLSSVFTTFDTVLEAVLNEGDPTEVLQRFTDAAQLNTMRRIQDSAGDAGVAVFNLFPNNPYLASQILEQGSLIRNISGAILGGATTQTPVPNMSTGEAQGALNIGLSMIESLSSGTQAPTIGQAESVETFIENLPALVQRVDGVFGEDIYQTLFAPGFTSILNGGALGPDARTTLAQVIQQDVNRELDTLRQSISRQGHPMVLQDGQIVVRALQGSALTEAERLNTKLRILSSPAGVSILGEGYVQTLEQDAQTSTTQTLGDEYQRAVTAGQRTTDLADRDRVVGGILQSLSGTESRGDFGASNQVAGSGGVGHYGRLQFSRGRLDDARRAGVLPEGMTPEQFLQDPSAQQQVELWHINDILDRIEGDDLSQYIGQEIGGTTVTIEGMVAMAHLGGFGGMSRFLQSGGSYNPQDAYGTSLADYLRIHGEGGTTEYNPDYPVSPRNLELMTNLLTSRDHNGEGSVVVPQGSSGGTSQAATPVEQPGEISTRTPDEGARARVAERDEDLRRAPVSPEIMSLIQNLTSEFSEEEILRFLRERSGAQ